MAFSDSSITELDSGAVARKIKTRFDGVDIHIPYGALIVNDVPVTTAAPLPAVDSAGNALLTTLSATATAMAASAAAIKTSVELIDNTVGGTELQVDVVSGAMTVSGAVSMGVPTGNTKRQKQLRLTASTGSTDLWSPAGGKRIAVKALTVTWQGANACRLTIWQGANADTTLSDTEPFLFDISLDANANGGCHLVFPDGYPWETDTADHELHVTLSAAKVVWIDAVGDERT